MVLKKILLLLSFLIGISIALIGHAVRAEVLFEGYSKILSGGVHVGYTIARYEYDEKKKQFIATTFLKTNEAGGNLTESLKAFATDGMKPISYQYTTLIGNQVKTIDAKFEKAKMLAVIQDGTKTEKINKPIPAKTFLSSLLIYVMLQSPQGLTVKTNFKYKKAIAEEDAAVLSGIAYINNSEVHNGVEVLRILNEFKGIPFVSLVTKRGEILYTKSPTHGIVTELVAKPSDATASFPVPSTTLQALFGNVPQGLTNVYSKAAPNLQGPPVPSTVPEDPGAPNKQQGVPAGQGIQIKSAPSEPAEKGN